MALCNSNKKGLVGRQHTQYLRPSKTFGGLALPFTLLLFDVVPFIVGIQIQNMKMVFNIYGTWRWVTFEKLVLKIYDFFYLARLFSHPV